MKGQLIIYLAPNTYSTSNFYQSNSTINSRTKYITTQQKNRQSERHQQSHTLLHPQLEALLGKILQDGNTVESYKIEEKGFIVCMIQKGSSPPFILCCF